MPTKFYIDFHCHPTLKPFGRSFPNNQNTVDSKKTNSVWFSHPPNLWAKIKNIIITITQFTQSDFSTLLKGNVRIIGAAISPLEKGFFVTKLGDGNTLDKVANIVTSIGKEKVDFIQHNQNYYSEFQKEYEFLLQLNNTDVIIDGKKCKYVLLNNANQIENKLSIENVLLVVPSIEGAHVFCENNNQRSEDEQILSNARKIKNLEYPPLYISLAHHFYNELAGHAYSLGSGLQKIIDQDYGVNTSITSLGFKVLDLLLDNSSGKRILVDIKHMSRIARRQYYDLLSSTEYRNENIPIIVSHGAVNGHSTVYSDELHSADNGLFYGSDINFYDDELILIAKSEGVFGLQFDERRAVGKSYFKKIRFKLSRKKMLQAQSKLLWNQIEHIAIVLDRVGLSSWDTSCIGSDFDGSVNPLNGFWTAKEFPLLASYLTKHAKSFLSSPANNLTNKNRDILPEQIIEKTFSTNALNFIKQNL